MRLQRPRDRVGRIGRRATVFRRAEPPFRIRLQHKAAQIGNRAIHLIDGFLPKRHGIGIQRIECLYAADFARAGEIQRDVQPDAPRSECIGDPCDLGQKFRRDHARVGVHIVDRATVDADRSHQPGIIAHAAQILRDVAVLPEDRLARVTALDRAVEIVPMIQNANRSRRFLADVAADIATSRDPSQHGEHAVQHSAFAPANDAHQSLSGFGISLDQEAFVP